MIRREITRTYARPGPLASDDRPALRVRRSPAAEDAVELDRDRDGDVVAPGCSRDLHTEWEPAGSEAERHLRDGDGGGWKTAIGWETYSRP